MTVVCKPVGPGNWTPLRLTYTGRRTAPMLVRVGERFTLGGVAWRICRVLP